MVTLTKDGKTLLTIADMVELFQTCRSTIYNWEKAGRLKPYKVGRRKYYLKDDVQGLFVEMY